MRYERRGEAAAASDGYGGCREEEGEEEERSEASDGSWARVVGPSSSSSHDCVCAWG